MVSRTNAKPMGSQAIADELRREIDDGQYPVGERLPSYRALVARFGVAVNTAQVAVQLLEKDGYVITESRRGAFVVERSARKPAEIRLRDLRRELGDLRTEIRQARDAVAGLERRVSGIVDRIDGGG